MSKSNITYIIIFAVIIGLGLLGLHWHNQDKVQGIQNAISESEGRIKELNKKAIIDSLLIKSYTETIDSAKLIKHDTIKIYTIRNVQKNNVIALGTDESIRLLSNNISK